MKLTKNQIDQIIQYFELGISCEDISKLSGISSADLEYLITTNKDISNAKQLGIRLGNIKVIKALFRSACGYTITENEEYKRTDKNGKLIFKDKKVIKKEIAPNMQSIKFWLENKDNINWKKDMEDVEKNMNIKISIEGKDIIVSNE